MTARSNELAEVRKKLSEALGENTAAYFLHLRHWFSKKCTKEEFDTHARQLLSKDLWHLHNQFFLAILTKCQSLVSLTHPVKAEPRAAEPGDTREVDRLKKGKIKKKNKSNKSTLEQRFQNFPAAEMAPEVSDTKVHTEERNLLFCVTEGTLPDIGLIHGRLLVNAWEEGIENTEDQAVSLTMVAVQHLLKNIITALLVSRNPYRRRLEAKHSIGCPVPNPWLRSTQSHRKLHDISCTAATETTLLNEAGLAPASRPDVDKAEAEAVYNAALGIQKKPASKEPFSLFDMLKVLKADPTVIPNHSVRSLNLERIIMRLNHE